MTTSKKKDYFWNTFAGVINAAEAVVMSMVVTRFGQLSDAGILSLAFAVGNVLMTIGKFGVRMYQVTDAKKQYSFGMYILQRVITIILMIVSMIGVLLYGKYESEKTYAIIIITAIYLVETFEDCFWGKYQADNKLYVGAQMFTSRWIIIIAVFIICIIITSDMTLALLYGGIAGCLVFVSWVLILFIRGHSIRTEVENADNTSNKGWLFRLFQQTIPLFLASFCSIFISNIPKFAIDRYLNDEIQACYGFVAMPVFVIGLLNQFIYQPTVVRLTNEYNDGNITGFRRNIRKQMIIVSGIMLACVIGAGLIGVPILSAVYHTDLSDYWYELVILQFAGGFLAVSGYFTVILTLMRKQRLILYGYITALVVGIIVLNFAVQFNGTIGASIGYLFVMVVLFAFYYISYRRIIKKP